MTSPETKKWPAASIRRSRFRGVVGITILILVLAGYPFIQLNFPYYTYEKLASAQAKLGLHAAEKDDSVVIIGHRGSGLVNVRAKSSLERRIYPVGNTMTGIRSALKAGVDWVEIDIRRTQDGTLVLFHDETVDRVTDGEGRVSEKTDDQLQALTLSVDAEPGERILTLEEFEEKFLKDFIDAEIGLILDIKESGLAKPVSNWARRVTEEKGLEAKKLVVFGEFAILKEFSGEGLRLGYTLTWKRERNRLLYLFQKAEIMKRLEQLDADLLILPVVFTTASLVQKAKEHDIGIWTYGTEDERDWSRISGLGVEGLIVDDPVRAVEFFD